MPAVRKVGNTAGFWSAASVTSATTSSVVHLPAWANRIVIYINTSATCVFTVQVASNADDAQGVHTDGTAGNWSPLFYVGTALAVSMTGASKAAIIIPDLAASYIRLASSTTATVTAGYEVSGN